MSKQRLREIAKTRREHLGRYLYEIDNAYRRITIPYIQSHGFPEFTSGYLQLLSQLDMLSEVKTAVLIERVGVSKQAVSRMIKKCEELGYIERKVDNDDERNKVIGFSKKGVELMSTAADAIKQAEKEIEKVIGSKDFKALKSLTSKVCEQLNLVAIDSEPSE